MSKPSYLDLPSGEISARVEKSIERLERCDICPRMCGVNRLKDERGVCQGGRMARVFAAAPHFGEEPPLVGVRGSGTIFLSGCNLSCVYCQNYEISWQFEGKDLTATELASVMLSLQDRGCHNINFVTPTHFVPQILEALVPAIEAGLHVPLVYNSGGYDSVETLRLLDGIFDIYMPDIKYGDDRAALKYSNAKDYVSIVKRAVLEMHAQVGDLVILNGVAVRGLIVRHLVLPGGIAGTADVVRFLKEEVSPDTYLNVMSQYRPEYKACDYPSIDRKITREEYLEALGIAVKYGLTRGLGGI